jgi:hypothetical protein
MYLLWGHLDELVRVTFLGELASRDGLGQRDIQPSDVLVRECALDGGTGHTLAGARDLQRARTPERMSVGQLDSVRGEGASLCCWWEGDVYARGWL